jgi:glycosyltransferase involved in cell wall biosynthesis
MEATGDLVVFIDADMEINMETISQYIKALDNADIAIASKWHPQSQIKMSWGRKLLSRTFNVLFRLLTGLNLKVTQVGLKAIKRQAFNNIVPRLAVKRYAFDVELLTVANLYGLRVKEMPVKVDILSSFKIKEIWRMLVDLLGITYRLKVIHWYQRPLHVGNNSK